MSKALGWGGGPWALVIELSVVCPWVCFGKTSQMYMVLFRTNIYNTVCVAANYLSVPGLV